MAYDIDLSETGVMNVKEHGTSTTVNAIHLANVQSIGQTNAEFSSDLTTRDDVSEIILNMRSGPPFKFDIRDCYYSPYSSVYASTQAFLDAITAAIDTMYP